MYLHVGWILYVKLLNVVLPLNLFKSFYLTCWDLQILNGYEYEKFDLLLVPCLIGYYINFNLYWHICCGLQDILFVLKKNYALNSISDGLDSRRKNVLLTTT